jgi:hypothetical protein
MRVGSWNLPFVAAALSFAGAYVVFAPDHGQSAVRLAFGSFGGAGCNIKGNVSISSGERIYHVPGQRHYADTVIRHEYGERYFCSEQEARTAGWRRSGV